MSGGYVARTESRVSSWALHLSAFAVLLAVLGGLYWQTVVAAVTVWWVSPTFSHCFLIIPVSLYLIWGKRRELAAMTPVALPAALFLALPVIAASFVGVLASINEIEQLAFVSFVQILLLAVLGLQVYRAILFPALFLFFLVPMGEYLIGPLQTFTTWFIDQGLNIIGILHYTEGNLIELANGAYQVAEACAGLRFLIATIAVGALFSYFTYRKWQKIVIFLVACVVVPIISNGFRALGIVLLAHYSDNRIAVGADHLVYGWGFSVVILLILMFVGMKFADEPKPVSADTAPPAPKTAQAAHIFPLTVVASLVAVSLVPAFASWRANTAQPVDIEAFSKPPVLGNWSVEPISRDWSPQYQDPDAKLEFALRQPDSYAPPVDVFVDYYSEDTSGHNLISSTNKMWDEDSWHPVEQGQTASASIAGELVHFQELHIASGSISRLIWWTYVNGSEYTASAMHVKLHRVRTALTGGSGAALLALSTPIDGDLTAVRARLSRAAAQLGPIRARVLRAKQEH